MSKKQNISGTERRRFRPYPEYKDSGVKWLERIPTGWSCMQLRYLALVNPKKKEIGMLDPALSISFIPMEAIREHGELNLEATKPLGMVADGYTYFRDGDVVIAKITPCFENGKAALAKKLVNGIAFGTTELHVLRPKPDIDARFLLYMTLSDQFRCLGTAEMYGAAGQKRVPEDFILNFSHPLPSMREQSIISDFLDRETEKIDALIARKERLIELLQEKRTALITQAVTKGLDPNVPMKDSSIEWLGKIPEHWECLALSRVTFARCDGPFGSGIRSEHYSESGLRVVRLQNIGSAEFCDADRAYINEEYGIQLGDHSVLPGDLLIAGLGDEAHPVGRACVAPEHIVPAMVKADCFRFRLDGRLLLARFAAYQLSATAEAAAGALSTGATRSRLNLTTMATRKVALPPLSEQAAIVSFLDRGCDENYALIARIQLAIDRLHEYRTALISAAVTGKIDVRDPS